MSFWAHNFSSFFFLKYLLASCLNCSGKTDDWPLQNFPCLQLLWPLHSSVVSLFPWLWRVLKSLGGMTDLQGHHLHGQGGSGSGYMPCSHQDTYHVHTARLLEASRGPAFPTSFLLCYGKAEELGLFITDFSWSVTKHMCKCFELSFVKTADLSLQSPNPSAQQPEWRPSAHVVLYADTFPASIWVRKQRQGKSLGRELSHMCWSLVQAGSSPPSRLQAALGSQCGLFPATRPEAAAWFWKRIVASSIDTGHPVPSGLGGQKKSLTGLI